jgi:hypothetical protein
MNQTTSKSKSNTLSQARQITPPSRPSHAIDSNNGNNDGRNNFEIDDSPTNQQNTEHDLFDIEFENMMRGIEEGVERPATKASIRRRTQKKPTLPASLLEVVRNTPQELEIRLTLTAS